MALKIPPPLGFAASLILCGLLSCESKDNLGFLERISSYTTYERAESELVNNSFKIDSVFLHPYYSRVYTDRVFAFPIDTFVGTLLIDFDKEAIVRCQLVFANQDSWLLHVPRNYQSSKPSAQLFEALRDYCSKRLGNPLSSGPKGEPQAWWSVASLIYDTSDSVIVLNISAPWEEMLPWYLRHSRLHSFNPFKLVSREDSDAYEHSLPGYSAYLYGSDTNFGMPGLTQTVYTSRYDFALNLWSSVIGIPRSLVDTVFNVARSKLGQPLEATSNSMTWDLQKYYYRLMRLDSFTVQSATVPKLDRSPEEAFRILNDSGLELSMIVPDSTLDRMEREASPAHDPRSVRILDDRFFHPLWKLRHANKSS